MWVCPFSIINCKISQYIKKRPSPCKYCIVELQNKRKLYICWQWKVHLFRPTSSIGSPNFGVRELIWKMSEYLAIAISYRPKSYFFVFSELLLFLHRKTFVLRCFSINSKVILKNSRPTAENFSILLAGLQAVFHF